MRLLLRILAFLILLVIGAGIGLLALAPRAFPDQATVNVRERNLPPSVMHPSGTDALGRDILSRNIHQIVDPIPGHEMTLAVIAILVILCAFILMIAGGRARTAVRPVAPPPPPYPYYPR